MPKPFAIVVAADEAGGIGQDGKLPWRLPGDMAHFKRLTSEAEPDHSNAVIMGRKTFDSLPPKFRPLPGRINVVLSRQAGYRPEGALAANALDAALAALAGRHDVDRAFVIGGGDLYRTALAHPRCTHVYLTRVHARFDCDTHLPQLDASFRLTQRDGEQRDGTLSYTFEVYERDAERQERAMGLLNSLLGTGTGLGPGAKAPEFTLNDQHGRPVSLADFRGKKNVVVYFYPKDDTPGCTRESCTFRDQYSDFSDAGAEVIGISSDSERSHHAFAEKHRLPFLLLSDPGGRVRSAYGVPSTLGVLPGRVTYVIDKEGVIRHSFNSQIHPEQHVREALGVLRRAT